MIVRNTSIEHYFKKGFEIIHINSKIIAVENSVPHVHIGVRGAITSSRLIPAVFLTLTFVNPKAANINL
jgi:hypothetical protein